MRIKNALRVAIVSAVILAATASCAAPHATMQKAVAGAESSAAGGSSSAASPTLVSPPPSVASQAVVSELPTSWMLSSDVAAVFMQWKLTNVTADGADLTGTIDSAVALPDGLQGPPPDQRAFTGHIAGGRITLTQNGATRAGAITATHLFLSSADPSAALMLSPATRSQFEAAVAALKAAHASGSANPHGSELDAQMKADLTTVALDLATAAIDAVPYVLRPDGDGIVEVVDPGAADGGIQAQLSSGDQVTMRLTADGADFCLVVTNPSAADGWMFTSDTGRIAAGATCPSRYTVDGSA